MRASRIQNHYKSWPSIYTSACGLICFFIMLEGVKIQTYCGSFAAAVILLLSIAIPIIIAEAIAFKSYKHPETGLDFSVGTPVDMRRFFVKLLGLYASMLFIGLIYFLYPEYKSGFYNNYYKLLKYLVPITCVLAIPYIFILDKYLIEKQDANWHAGMFVLCKFNRVDKEIFKNHLLGWLVKGFFLPLMFTYLVKNIGTFQNNSIVGATVGMFNGNPAGFYHTITTLIFTIDLAWVSVGYMATFKILNSHIRTVEPTFFGWFVALVCYHPFWSSINANYLRYNSDGYNFDSLLGAYPPVMVAWGVIVLLLLCIYVWATLQFGIRFSNLTNRGIITNGPYKYCKHPAYVSKNLSWWLITVPFISNQGFAEAVRNCLLLANVNLIYFLRAKTEEAHLGKDPAYQAYLAYMKEHSLYSKIKKFVLRKPLVA